jgi:DNA-binding XRE family transcriptional regulator
LRHFRLGMSTDHERDAHLAMLTDRGAARRPVASPSDFDHSDDVCHADSLAGNHPIPNVQMLARTPRRPSEWLRGTFGHRAKTVRERLRLSRTELARRSGLSLNTIWGMEWRTIDPDLDQMIAVARALKVSMWTMFAGSESEWAEKG